MSERISLPEWLENYEKYEGCKLYLQTFLGRLEVTGSGPSPGWVVTGSGWSRRSFLIGGDRLLEVERPQ